MRVFLEHKERERESGRHVNKQSRGAKSLFVPRTEGRGKNEYLKRQNHHDIVPKLQ